LPEKVQAVNHQAFTLGRSVAGLPGD
jgi:hypothetical protein